MAEKHNALIALAAIAPRTTDRMVDLIDQEANANRQQPARLLLRSLNARTLCAVPVLADEHPFRRVDLPYSFSR